MAFDKYTKELHDLTAEHAGPTAAKATFWMVWMALWCMGLTIIIGAIILAMKFLFPYVSVLSRVPLPQMGNVALSFVIAVAVVGFAGVWFLKTFKRARDAVSNAFATQLQELTMDVNALRNGTDSRVSELLRVFGNTADRVNHLESHAASIQSTNNAFSELNKRIVPMERRPDGMRSDADLQQWALARLLNSPSANSVGHPLTIHEGQYGVAGRAQIDVTALLRNSIKDNRIRLTVTNETMGGRDPLYGAPKQLLVRYSCGEHVYEVPVPEGEELKIPD